MKTETKKAEKCQVKLVVTLDAEEVKVVVKDVERTFVREARIPGFRPGKAPIEIVRKNFADQMKQETVGAMLRKYYHDAVKQENLSEVGLVDVQDVSHDDNGGTFTAVVEIKPEFKLPTYKGLKIGFKDTKVEESAVAAQIEQMRVSCAKYVDAKEGECASDGDFIQIDYAGTIDGQPIAEIAPDAKVVASGTGFWTQLEEGRFLKEILDAVRGMKAGEMKEGIKAKFDKESAPDPLKGKKAVYTVTLKAFRRRELPNDAEFVEKMKVESVEKLTADVRERMEQQAIQQESARRENEAVELLLKKCDFDVPASQVNRARDHYLNELAQRAQYAGLSAEYFEQNRDKILADAEENAVRQVRLWYIIDAIAAEEKLEVKDDDKGRKVIDLVLANAKH